MRRDRSWGAADRPQDGSVLPGGGADATLRPLMSEAPRVPTPEPRLLSLEELGWSAELAVHATAAEASLRPARIASVYSAHVEVWLGETAGRGRMDRAHQREGKSPKAIWVYPLATEAALQLCRQA